MRLERPGPSGKLQRAREVVKQRKPSAVDNERRSYRTCLQGAPPPHETFLENQCFSKQATSADARVSIVGVGSKRCMPLTCIPCQIVSNGDVHAHRSINKPSGTLRILHWRLSYFHLSTVSFALNQHGTKRLESGTSKKWTPPSSSANTRLRLHREAAFDQTLPASAWRGLTPSRQRGAQAMWTREASPR